MSNKEDLLTSVGRLVQGSLYDGQTTDAENRPLVYKTGPNMGQPRQDFYFALAIAKGTEQFWYETEWGAIIWRVGHVGFPNGQTKAPGFAWKVIDGDSHMPNKVGKRPCDREGYPGHWVLNFSCGFAPSIWSADGNTPILEPYHVNCGDYIQVFGSVSDNESMQQPGIYLNHKLVAFAGYGKRITVGADPKSVGFGKSPLPSGASATPLAQGFNPAPVASQSAAYAPPPATAPAVYSPPPPVTPHTAILTPPVPPMAPPAAIARVMTPKAGGATYDQFISQGWTDALLIQHGMMQA